MEIKFKSKKAEMTKEAPVYLTMLAIFLVLVIFALIKWGIPLLVSESIPDIGPINDKIDVGTFGYSIQPVSLRKSDICVDYDFYWADGNGNPLPIAPTEIKPAGHSSATDASSGDFAYVAIKFKEGIGDLSNAGNIKAPLCKDYKLDIYLVDKSTAFTTTTIDQGRISSFDFKQIQSFQKATFRNVEYYLYQVTIRDNDGLFGGYRAEYRFEIRDSKNNLIRQGSTIYVNS